MDVSLAKVADWLWTVVGVTVAIIYKMMNRRIDVMSARITQVETTKADRTEVDRQRSHVEKIYDKLEQQGKLLARIDAKLEMRSTRRTDS